MAQHFLLSAAARMLPLADVARITEAKAYRMFCEARWGRSGEPDSCPHCGVVGQPWKLRRRKFKCREKLCRKEFSVTSGTIFANRKLKFRDIVFLISASANSVKGKSALQLSRELGVQYRTAWVNLMKLREPLREERNQLWLTGEVEMDGMYLNRHRRPPNRRADRVDGRLAANRHPGDRCVLVMRERDNRHELSRTVPLVILREDEDNVLAAAQRHISTEATIITDGHHAYPVLANYWRHLVVEHQDLFAHPQEEGEVQRVTNQAESYHVRIRRGIKGIHHRMNGTYLDLYVCELAWREDYRRFGNDDHVEMLLKKALAHPVSRYLSGVWQGNHAELDTFLFRPEWQV